MKKALITGITGQDGSYLAELLLEKGYEVWGMYRRSSVDSHKERIEPLGGKINLICGDLTDHSSLEKVVNEAEPDEIYNLAAQSQVRISFDQPFLTKEINWLGVEKLLNVAKKNASNAKIYQASTSEMFGNVTESPQNENTPFKPVSPYGESKLNAYKIVKQTREEGHFACNGILFNHESPRRGIEFVTRKLTEGLARIKLEIPQRETGIDYLELGNLDAKRDWGFSGDYVEAMWLMLQQDMPKDYVIATGETHTVREFVEASAEVVGIKINWEGEGINEVGYDQKGGKIVRINKQFFRPNELYELKGDPSRAKEDLGWAPKVSFKELVKMMAESDLKRLKEYYHTL